MPGPINRLLVCLLALFGAVLLAPSVAQADSVRCGSSLVQTGDPAIVVRKTCGAPDFVDPWIAGAGGGFGQGVVLSMEQWTYNRGPGRLLQIMVFRDGKLYSVTDGGYGFSVNQGQSCRPTDLAPGLSKYRLLVACGEPAQRNVVGFLYSTRGRTANGQYYRRRGAVPVYREQWIYNFGGNRLLREVTLENAVIVDVETLDRGFD